MSEAPDRDSKTEEPTEKRLADALAKGKGPFSRELPILLSGCAIWLMLAIMLDGVSAHVAMALLPFIEHSGDWSLSVAGDAAALVQYVAHFALLAVVPPVALLAIAGIAGALPQSRGAVLERLRPEFSRISPAAGWRRLFGAEGWTHAGKSLLKIAFVAAIALWCLRDLTRAIVASHDVDVGVFLPTLSGMLTRLVGAVLLAFLVVAIFDAGLAGFIWRRGLRMTKQEVKDEAKQTDGDPAIKQRIRMLARQRLRRRMIAAVPRATFVVANPTHYAVAMRYVREEGGAPRVVAKGRDLIALRIREVAEQRGIPVIEDRWLARTLHDSVPVDAVIPPEFYKAVAKIIFVLSRQNQRQPGSR